ncbi:uncharacterized protein [Henckelia pumila]|uniref:uncharacterized protein n=1 Tax=Henckelia pumila TaxID=405737 RepID=UPI003C6E7FAD
MAQVVFKAFAAMFLLFVAFFGTEVLAQTHHVVGGDDGWSSDLKVSSWLMGRVFRVGDKIWFRYPAAEETIAELQSLEEFISCDITNPIRMYADGLNDVTLEKEGTRYFTSGNFENCKNGMKLPVQVEPSQHEPSPAPPTQPKPPPPSQPEPSPAPPTQPKPSPPIQPEPEPEPEPAPAPPTQPKPLPPVKPEPEPAPAPPTQPKPLPPIQPEPAPAPPTQPKPLPVPTPPEPIPIHPPSATPPPPTLTPPPPSSATTTSNVLSFVYCGLFLSYFVL